MKRMIADVQAENVDPTATSAQKAGRPAFDSRLPDQPRPAVKRKSKFSWTLLNFWLDSAMLVNFLALVCVSVVIRFVFPAASAAQGWSLWGRGIDAWMAGQFALLAVLSLGILVHVMLHWSWVCGVFFGKLWKLKKGATLPDDGTRTIYGVGFMILLLNLMGLFIAAAAICIHSPL